MFVDVKTHLHKLKVAEHVNFPVVLQGALSFVTKTYSSFAVITKFKILLIDGNGKIRKLVLCFTICRNFGFLVYSISSSSSIFPDVTRATKQVVISIVRFLISSVLLEVAPLSPINP